MADHDILPGLFHHLFRGGYVPGASPARRDISGHELIAQARDIVDTHDANRQRVHDAFTHHPEADKHRAIFGKRVDVLRRMISRYEDNPDELTKKIKDHFSSPAAGDRPPTRNPKLKAGKNNTMKFQNLLKIKAAGRISKSSGKYYNEY